MIDFKVSFALLLYDEFDGAPITDPSVIFRWDGRLVTPLRKREGFYVFRGLEPNRAELEIERPHFHKTREYVDPGGLDPGYPVVRVRLARKFPGTFSDCEWLEGEYPEGCDVMAFAEEARARFSAPEEDRVTVLNCPAALLIGRRFSLRPEKADTFLLTQSPAPGVYLADKKLPGSVKQVYYRAYLSKCGPDGRYHIPVEFGQIGKITGTAFYDKGVGKWVYASATGRS
ncbi:MAG: hypothetical protein FWH02_02650 [Oscillospiraceae bacterium]|nr:hypothetical protein [Oscillospiraceae bacterium]